MYIYWETIQEFIKEEFSNRERVNIIEIGSHVGSDTSWLFPFVKKGKMLAFEPDPRNIPVLKQRMEGSNITIIEKAVGSKPSTAKMYLSSGTNSEGEEHTASSSLLPPKNHLNRFEWVKFDQEAKVEVTILDREWQGGVVDLIWADVQGAEVEMIKGAQSTLMKTRFLFTEFNDGEMYEGQQGLDAILEALPGEWGIVRIFGDEVLLQNKAMGSHRIKPEPPLSVVMQGPILEHTKQAVDSIRTHFPNAELILSTWENEDVDGIDADKIFFSKDPGPGTERAAELLRANVDRMVISSFNGIQNASYGYVMKVRSDTIFTGNGCLKHIGRWPKRSSQFQGVFDERVIVPNVGTADPEKHVCFQISDWVHLGLKSDLCHIFSPPLGEMTKEPPISPEQYLWTSSIKRKNRAPDIPELEDINQKTPELIQATKDFMANNFVILDTKAQFEFYGGRYPDMPDDVNINMRHAKWAKWYGELL